MHGVCGWHVDQLCDRLPGVHEYVAALRNSRRMRKLTLASNGNIETAQLAAPASTARTAATALVGSAKCAICNVPAQLIPAIFFRRFLACLSGTYSTAGSSQCSACPAGSTSSGGASSCTCNAGYSSSGSGVTLTCTGKRSVRAPSLNMHDASVLMRSFHPAGKWGSHQHARRASMLLPVPPAAAVRCLSTSAQSFPCHIVFPGNVIPRLCLSLHDGGAVGFARLTGSLLPFLHLYARTQIACLPGSYSADLASTCTKCPDNSASTSNASTCTCSAGYAGAGLGAALTCTGLS